MSVYQRKERFEEFVMEEFLGSGASAEVWRVRDSYDQVLALKIFAPGVGLDNIGRAIFREEFERTFDLDHPNILRALRYGDHDNKPFIVMPLSQQGSLMKLLRERMFERKQAKQSFETIFSEEELAAVIYNVSNALIFLKANGILHRDIKPDNILIMEGADGVSYKVTDFGISTKIRKTIHRQTHQKINTDSGLTPAYAAPEIYRGDISYQSDIFSLGVSLYELASGETPLVPSGVGIGLAMLNGAELPPLQGDFTKRFKQLLELSMHADPQERCSAEDLRDMSKYFLQNGGWPAITLSSKYKAVPVVSPTEDEEVFFDSGMKEHLGDGTKGYALSNATDANSFPDSPTFASGGDSFHHAQTASTHDVSDINKRGQDNAVQPENHLFGSESDLKPQKSKRLLLRALGGVAVFCLLGLTAWIGIRYFSTNDQDIAANYIQSGKLANAVNVLSDLCTNNIDSAYCIQRDNFQHILKIGTDYSAFQNGRARYRDKKTNLYGYFDLNGKIIIPAEFVASEGFNTYGLTYAAKRNQDGNEEKRWGMIDTNGIVVVPFQYRALSVDTNLVILEGRDTLYFKKITSF